MKITYYSSTSEILSELGSRIKSTRISMQKTQRELADATGLSLRTISNIETGKDVSFSTVIDVLRALNQLPGLDASIPEQSVRPSQIAALGKQRERASSKGKSASIDAHKWKWGDDL